MSKAFWNLEIARSTSPSKSALSPRTMNALEIPREHWRVTDTLDMMQQLGAIPAAENAQVEDA
jgi:hypothetical protein